MRIRAIILILVLAVCAGCRRNAQETTVARVDSRALTLEEIRGKLDTTRGISEVQVQQFVRRWLNDEMLYREALRRGLDQRPELSERVDEFKRQLLINSLLQTEVYNDESLRSTADEINAYYDAHRNEFVLTQDIARVSYLLFSDRDAATAFRNTVLNGRTWSQAAEEVERNPQRAVTVLGRSDSAYATQQSLTPPELWRVTANSREGEPSFPISTAGGYYVLTVWKYAKAGQIAEQHAVRGEIIGRLAVQRRMRTYDSLVAALRSRHNVEVFSAGVRADTGRSKNSE